MEHSYYEIYKVEFINWTGLDDKLSNDVFDQLENKIHDLTVLKFESMDSLNQIIKHDFAAKFLQLVMGAYQIKELSVQDNKLNFAETVSLLDALNSSPSLSKF